MKDYILTTGEGGLDKIINYLNEFGIQTNYIKKDKYEFWREIEFAVYDVKYRIEWYMNQSVLFIGTNIRSARIPFRYMYYDKIYPLVGKNGSIGFAQNIKERKYVHDFLFDYAVFRIPLEI